MSTDIKTVPEKEEQSDKLIELETNAPDLSNTAIMENVFDSLKSIILDE